MRGRRCTTGGLRKLPSKTLEPKCFWDSKSLEGSDDFVQWKTAVECFKYDPIFDFLFSIF